ncbi:NifB/NifX family molybdenum-iron cluster-binding protein [Limisalsivibrio acetivorans]|uniref:NifB/NifX family molybdenum-iron cluster-binding protein n=1 Tax=Limisalsivibrio acetivorans TaxID=1304888 RepID=UPI0003B4D555|nr:NifB/NifX family molybdenum-iron cluster-binding protein [Limisalsivibrio acetivorans]
MKLCFPVQKNNGLESAVYNHFGSAPMFMVADTDNNEIYELDNGDVEHVHGACNPASALGGAQVDAVVVGGIGQGALTRLKVLGKRVFLANSGTISDNINLFKENKLRELELTATCGDHHHSHGHDHGGSCCH